jgi:hypothetical protein
MIQPGLLRILWRQALPATLLGTLALGSYALFWPYVMTGHDVWPWLAVLVHCLLLAGLLGRFGSPAFGFLYSRGYSRDALWGHIMLASALSFLTAWLPLALILWTGLRSVIHDNVFQSPYFPVMAPCEHWTPWAWLALYLLLMSAFHYVWIRSAQPTRGSSSGVFLAFALIVALVTAGNMNAYLDAWFTCLSAVSYIVVLVSLLFGARALHRSLEVRT